MLPFATDLIATYLREGNGEHLAGGGIRRLFLAMSVTFAVLNRHMLFAKAHMLVQPIEADHAVDGGRS